MLRNNDGNIAIFFALLLPVLLGFAGAGFDYSRYRSTMNELQEVADMAALAGAREYMLMSDNNVIPKAVAKQIADAGIAHTEVSQSANSVTSSVDEDTTVTVEINATLHPSFLVGMFKNPLYVTVDSTAQAVGGANICVIALAGNAQYTLYLEGSAQLSGAECAVYSNSIRNMGLGAYGNTIIKSVLNCTAGGYDGSDLHFDPIPLTDCPPKEDPLSARPEPTSGSCGLLPNLVKDISTTLTPGVYCGGLTIDGTADVTLLPGIYVMKDGNLSITANARVEGEGVGFYFEGANSRLEIGPDTTISLSAPLDGEMAGLLMFQSRTANPNTDFLISSNNAETLVGTIYLPQGRLWVNADAPVASESAYTAIIVNKLYLSAAVNLVLNSDYNATNVPVPAGLAGAGGEVRLRD